MHSRLATPHSPASGARSARSVARPAAVLAGPSLDARLHDALRLCRPVARVMGRPLPPVVLDASKAGRPLVTSTFARAVDALCAMPGVPLERLEALADALRAHVRARRGVAAPSLAEAMRAEEAAGAALNLAQWCGGSALSLGDVCAMRQRAVAQLHTTQDLIDACDRWTVAQLAPQPSVARAHALARGAVS